jgi:nodulation protein E
MRPVAITGMGAISAAGLGAEALWTACRDGSAAIGPLVLARSTALRVKQAAQVRDFDPAAFLDRSQLMRCDRFTQFAHVAAREAVAQSGIDREELAGSRTAVIIGTGVGGFNSLDDGHYTVYVEKGRPDPMGIPRQMPSAASSFVSLQYGATGPCFAVSSACASGAQAIGLGAMLIRQGVVDRAIVGGSEAATTPVAMRYWEALRVLTMDRCRPFSRGRDGMVIGEGAAVFVLEALDLARARGARPLARLAGYGTSSDARDFIQPDVEGATSAVADALRSARLDPSAIGYINAHGTATVLNDANEARALRRVFGDVLDRVPVSSSKPVVGHGLGAAGALELVVTIRALAEQIAPPQINVLAEDPDCPLHLPMDGPVACRMEAALSNSFAFGGINACLVVTHPDR